MNDQSKLIIEGKQRKGKHRDQTKNLWVDFNALLEISLTLELESRTYWLLAHI